MAKFISCLWSSTASGITSGLVLSSLLFSACVKQKIETATDKRSRDSQAAEAEGSGTMSATSTGDQKLTADSSSEISGASVTVRPGALAIDSDMEIQEGESIADDTLLTDVGL